MQLESCDFGNFLSQVDIDACSCFYGRYAIVQMLSSQCGPKCEWGDEVTIIVEIVSYGSR